MIYAILTKCCMVKNITGFVCEVLICVNFLRCHGIQIYLFRSAYTFISTQSLLHMSQSCLVIKTHCSESNTQVK